MPRHRCVEEWVAACLYHKPESTVSQYGSLVQEENRMTAKGEKVQDALSLRQVKSLARNREGLGSCSLEWGSLRGRVLLAAVCLG